MDPRLEQLLALPSVWQASRSRRISSVLSTGYPTLDAQLHDGGWPSHATTELLLPENGLGELRLMIPGLRQVQQQRPWLTLIAPPFVPYATALAQQGIQPEGLLIIQPKSQAELLWAAEQVLQSGCCGAVATWTGTANLNSHQLRRLQQAAHRGHSWHILFRHSRLQRQASPSALRLNLSSESRGLLQVEILKQPGGWAGQKFSLQLQPDLSQLQRLTPDQLPLPVAQFNRSSSFTDGPSTDGPFTNNPLTTGKANTEDKTGNRVLPLRRRS